MVDTPIKFAWMALGNKSVGFTPGWIKEKSGLGKIIRQNAQKVMALSHYDKICNIGLRLYRINIAIFDLLGHLALLADMRVPKRESTILYRRNS